MKSLTLFLFLASLGWGQQQRPTNSIIQNEGTMDHVEIIGGSIEAPPNGTAKVIVGNPPKHLTVKGVRVIQHPHPAQITAKKSAHHCWLDSWDTGNGK